MKWVFLILVVANGGLYLWVNDYQTYNAVTVADGETNINVEGMELVHERQATSINKDVFECMRIGPFSTADTFSRASRLLINAGFGFTRDVVSARELRNFRVYLGPFTTQAAKETAERRLRQQGLDFYMYEDKDGELFSVAGLFSEGEAAGAYVAELKEVGLDAKARSEVRTLGPWRWLEVADAVTEERRNALRGFEWEDAKAQVAGVPCLQEGSSG
jgi:hypothetical protein